MKLFLSFFALALCLNVQATNIDSLVQARVQQANHIQNEKGDYVKATKLLEETLTLAKEHDVSGVNFANIYHKLGVNAFYLQEYLKGIEYMSKAIDFRQKHLGKENLETINSIYVRSILFDRIGKIEQAIQDLKWIIEAIPKNQTLSIAQRDSILAIRYFALGDFYTRLKDVPNILFYSNKSENYYLKHHDSIHPSYLASIHFKGIAYELLGKYEEAAELYQNTIKGYDKIESIDIAGALHSLGLLKVKMGDYEAASSMSERALKIYRINDDRKGQAGLLSNLVEINANLKKYDKAIRVYEEGHQIANNLYQTSHHPIFGELDTNRGELELLRKQPKAALDFFQKALQAHILGFQPVSNTENPEVKQSTILSKFDLLHTFEGKGKAFLQLFQDTQEQEYLEHALATFQTLDELIVRILSDYKVEASKFELLKQTRSIYEQAIQTALLLYEQTNDKKHLTQAYQFSAKNKAIMLLESIRAQSAAQYANIPDEVLLEEKNNKKQVYQLEAKVSKLQQTPDSTLDIYKDSLFHARLAYDRLLERLEREYPDYYQLRCDFSNVLSPKIIQQQLVSDEGLIEYFVGEEQIYVFTLTPTEFDYYQIPKTAAFDTTVNRFKQAVSGFSKEQYQNRFQKDAYQLYDWLLKTPLQKLSQPAQQLTIIPDDVLTQVAFDALLTEETNAKAYLLHQHKIRYLYSSQFLLQEKSRTNEDAELLAAFGIEYDPYTLEGIDDNSNISLYDAAETVRALGKLTYSDDEAVFVANLLDGQEWLNETATKEVFLNYASKFKILHLAMHGVVDVEQPLNSSLIFTRTNDSTDFLLRAADIYNLEIPAEMVVLSACNTGTGQVQKGEGIRTLARAFQYAGAKNLVASLWNAPDQATKEIMEYFYQYLKEGQSKDEALQKAKQQYLENASPAFAQPAYWAHLVTIGDVTPIDLSSGLTIWWWVIPIILLLGVFFWWSRRF